MTKIKVELEFDEQELGEGWMNPYSLDLLLYSEEHTKKELLRVLNYSIIEDTGEADSYAEYESENGEIIRAQ